MTLEKCITYVTYKITNQLITSSNIFLEILHVIFYQDYGAARDILPRLRCNNFFKIRKEYKVTISDVDLFTKDF